MLIYINIELYENKIKWIIYSNASVALIKAIITKIQRYINMYK